MGKTNFPFFVLFKIDRPAYVAVALSTDSRMGDDAVMECVPENGAIRAYASWTTPAPNLGVTRQGVVSAKSFIFAVKPLLIVEIFYLQSQNSIRLLEATYSDGVIYCRIRRDAFSNVMGRNFDLINNKYNLLVATGSSLKRNLIQHAIAYASPRDKHIFVFLICRK